MAQIRVPQKDDEIVLSHGGDAGIHYPVKNGVVEVDDADVARFLANVPGSSFKGASAPSTPAGKE